MAAITDALSSLAPANEWSIDLNVPDRILSYHGPEPLNADAVKDIVRGIGFEIEQLPD